MDFLEFFFFVFGGIKMLVCWDILFVFLGKWIFLEKILSLICFFFFFIWINLLIWFFRFKVICVFILMILLFCIIMEEDLGKICIFLGMKKNWFIFIWYFGLNFLIFWYLSKFFFLMIECVFIVLYLIMFEFFFLYWGLLK